MAGKAITDQQIRAKLETLDALNQSGLGIEAFAQSQGLAYLQLRAWQSHAARWRARLAGQPPSSAQPSAPQFVQLQVPPQHQAPHQAQRRAQHPSPGTPAHTLPAIRIECARGSRSATLHWPTNAPVQCAQWLSAYLA